MWPAGRLFAIPALGSVSTVLVGVLLLLLMMKLLWKVIAELSQG